MVGHTSYDVSEEAMRKRANSVGFLKLNITEKPVKPKLVGSADGRLNKIMFAMPHYVENTDHNPLWKIYVDLFLKLPSYTEFLIVVHEKTEKQIRQWFAENAMSDRLETVIMPHYINFTIWAEDPYAIIHEEESNKCFMLEPHSFPRWEDGFIAYYVTKKMGWDRIHVPFYFEGGNLLVGDDFFLAGADYAIESVTHAHFVESRREGESHTELVTRLYKENLDFNRELYFIGSSLPVPSTRTKKFKMNGEEWKEKYFQKNEGGTVQPLFHIDMFITLAGGAENGKYILLVGDPGMAAGLLEMPVHKYSVPELFDDIAEIMVKRGFEVVRNPLPVIYFDDEKKKKRSWHFATYNNCIVEIIDRENKTVWLPTYGHGNWKELEKTDRANKEILEGLGFKVVLLEDYHPLIEDSGSLHCIKKYLERG